jgi:hypothetical protein
MSIIDNDDQAITGPFEVIGLFNKPFFAGKMSPEEINIECLTEDFQSVGIGVESPCYGNDGRSFGGVLFDGLLDDCFSRTGFTQEET